MTNNGMILAKADNFKIEEGNIEIIHESFEIFDLKEKFKYYFKTPAYIFSWQLNTSGFMKWNGETVETLDNSVFYPEYVEELRIFNSESELHICNSENKFIGRFIKDNSGKNKVFYVDTFSRLFGKCAENHENISVLKDEGRKLEQLVPIKIMKYGHAGLKTRNYIEEVGEFSALSYTDYRFFSLETIE